ncbi:MAG: hypothetical protein L0228_06405 [Planctomycetes bacterium]|nr:hypothetical protein [Planctomycetota bacterium]
MRRVLAIDDVLASGGVLELSDDRPSCKLFWATMLDYAFTENVKEVGFNPADGDDCILVVIDRQTYPMVPPPSELRPLLLRYAQEIALGQLCYTLLVRLGSKPFVREQCGPLLVRVGSRRSEWNMDCTRDSIRFMRVPRTADVK